MKTNLKILAAFILLGVGLFWPVFLGRVNLNGNLLVSFYNLYGQNLPFKDTGWDALRIYFPFYQVTFEQIRAGIVPLWNPYAFSGHPHAADFQSAVFYPLNIFGVFMPLVDFWHLLRVTPTIMAAFFTYLFLKNRKFSLVSSIFGAVTFGFSPFILTWGEEVVMAPHSIVWLPLILYAIDRYQEVLGKRYLLIIAISTAFSFLGGYMQTSIYMFLFIAVYLVFISDFKKLFLTRAALGFMASFVIGTGISAIQLVPSAELFFNSARSQITLTSKLYEFLLPWESLLTYLAPDFFGSPSRGNFFRTGSAQYYEGILFVGIAAFIFATFTMLYRRKERLVWFLMIISVVSLLTTLDSPISRWFLTLPIPFLSTSIPNRVLFIPAFCLAVLASFGMDLWLKGKIKVWGTLGFFAFCYFLMILALLVVRHFNLPYFDHASFKSPENTLTSLRNLIIPLFVFGAGVAAIYFGETTKRKNLACVLILGISVCQIFYFSQKYFTFTNSNYVFPENEALDFVKKSQNLERTWGVGDNFFPNNLASYYGIYWPGGYDSLNNRAYGEFTYAMQGNNLSDFVFRADAGLGQGNARQMFEWPGTAQRQKLMDLVGVRYLLANRREQELLEKHGFVKVFGSADGPTWVFENPSAQPRAFLASNYEGPPPLLDVTNMTTKQIEDERRKLIFQRMLDPAFDLKNVLILEKSSPISPQFGAGEARIVSYRPNEVVVDTMAAEPKLLFLSDNYYPGWKATVDGERTEILRANYTFRAVPLAGGEHKVRFYYDPMSFKVGLIISVLSLMGLVFLVRPRFKF